MQITTNRVPVSARPLPLVVAFGCIASLGLATSTSAGTILQFSQTNFSDFLNASATTSNFSGTTILSLVNSLNSSASIPVTITYLSGSKTMTVTGLETFVVAPFNSSAATTATNVTGSEIQQLFNGTIALTAPLVMGGAVQNFLTVNFVHALLSGPSGGNAATLSASTLPGSSPPASVVFTSSVIPTNLFSERDFTLGFSGLLPSLTVTGSSRSMTINNFTTQNTGTFSGVFVGVVPEPASLVSGCSAVLAGLSCLGWRRFKSFRVVVQGPMLDFTA